MLFYKNKFMTTLKFTLLIVSFLLFSMVNFIFSYNVVYKDTEYIPNITIEPNIDNYLFIPGQNISGYVIIKNNDPYYYPQIFLAIMLIKEDTYMTSNNQVLYAELKMISNLLPYQNYVVNFTYRIPENISSGNYKLMFYLYTAVKHIIGNPNFFNSTFYREIYINNTDFNNYPWISILKNETKLINDSNILKLNLAIYSNDSTSAKIRVKLAKWDALLYGPILDRIFVINLTKGYQTLMFDLVNISNFYADYYYLLIEVYSEELLQDMYIIPYHIYGEAILFDGIYLDKNGKLLVVLSTYPNNSIVHKLYNVELKVFSNKQKFTKTIKIGDVVYDHTTYVYIEDYVPISNGMDLCFNLTYQKEFSGLVYLSNICYTYYVEENKNFSISLTRLKVILVMIVTLAIITYFILKK